MLFHHCFVPVEYLSGIVLSPEETVSAFKTRGEPIVLQECRLQLVEGRRLAARDFNR